MANWSLHQETITALPVVKRAKHAIHFQRPDGLIQADFSGAPCHYLDGGLWKPIDTRLIVAADGSLGAPHSDIRLFRDGYVKVGGYQQFTDIPGAKRGAVYEDRIIRSFPGGEQHLILKEDGYREEIHLQKRGGIPVEKFIAKTEGALDSKYHLHPVIATDAKGNSYTFNGDVKAFGDWLDVAAYPVVIDPDFGGSTGDGVVYGQNADYATARSTSTDRDITTNYMTVGQYYNGTNLYDIRRSFEKFDTSSIGTGSTVTQVNLKLVVITDFSGVDFDVQIVKQDWSGQDPLGATTREAAYDGCLSGTSDDSIWRNTSGMSVNTQYASGNLATAWVNKTGSTYYSLRSSRDSAGNAPTGLENIRIATQDHATAGYRPVLTVLYTVPSTAFVPILDNSNSIILNGSIVR